MEPLKPSRVPLFTSCKYPVPK